jgi:dTDP-4-dehydrorhamnose 3,5-epimerase-like enzyme
MNKEVAKIPPEISDFFNTWHFEQYPKITIPQDFRDERGFIKNLVDGAIGDVAHIHSTPGAVRANHFHITDWHLTYLISGSITYSFAPSSEIQNMTEIRVNPGDLIFTPPQMFHRMLFLEESHIMVMSRNSRKSLAYESDTVKVE